MTAALEGREWSAARRGRTLPPGKNRYPFYRRLGGPQDRSGRAENLVPTRIRSRAVQPVVSHYTDWATRPQCGYYEPLKHKRIECNTFVNQVKPRSAPRLHSYQLVIASHISTLDILLHSSATSRDRDKYTFCCLWLPLLFERCSRAYSIGKNCLTSCSDWELLVC